MSFGYTVRPQADREIDIIADDLADEGSLDVGLRFLAEVYETFALLASQPEIGWPCKIRHPQLIGSRH